MKRVLVIFACSLLAASAAFATTYVRVEKDGSKTYSDRPLPGGQPVALEPAQTYSSTPAASATPAVPLEQRLVMENTDTFRYESCALSPSNDQTFTNPEAVTVSVELKPNIRVGDIIDLRIDGTQVGDGASRNYSMVQPFRGAHSVTFVIRNRYGRTLCSSNTTFHVFRPTLNSPTRRKAG